MGTKRSDIDPLKTYGKTASAIQELDKIGSLPMPLNVALLDQGKGITPTLVDNQVKWHKNCRNRFSELKLDSEISKSQKRKSSDIYTSLHQEGNKARAVFSVIKVLDKFTWFLP